MKLDKEESAKAYIRDVINSSKFPRFTELLGDNINKELLDDIGKFSAKEDTSHIMSGETDLAFTAPEGKRIFDKLNRIYSKEWNNRKAEIRLCFSTLKDFIEHHRNALVAIISESTGIEWTTSKIIIYPAVYTGGTIIGSKIYIGAGKDFKRNYIDVMIHELVHINTRAGISSIQENLKFMQDSKEITTTIITNKIIDKLNIKSGLNLEHQKFSTQQSYLAEMHYEKLIKISEKIKNFTDTVKIVDMLLVNASADTDSY